MNTETRALQLLHELVTEACEQSGPGHMDRDVNMRALFDVCHRAEELLYMRGWV